MEEKDEKQQPVRPTYPTLEYNPPVGNYDDWSNAYHQILTSQAQRIDPQRQAEEDAKLQRGRNFWTGANLFTNVIANAINARGTAKGAPSMTWNNAAEQKMYDDWKKLDAETRANRRAAQQRYDELTLADAKWRNALGQQRHQEELNAYNTGFNARQRAAEAQYKADMDEYNRQQKEQREDEVYQRNLADQRQNATTAFNRQAYLQRQSFEHQETVAEKRAQLAKGYNKGTKTIRIGNTDFVAETEEQANSNISQVYRMVLDAYNRTQDNLHQQQFDSKPENEYSFINAYLNHLMTTDPQLKSEYDAFVRDHAASINSNNQNGGQQHQQNTPPSGHVR